MDQSNRNLPTNTLAAASLRDRQKRNKVMPGFR
jgi:hypothetical protein